jgi:CRP-like cAMP-binding protein
MDSKLLAPLDDAERRAVLSVARRRRFKRGEVLFHEGDPGDTLHMIDKGHVAMRITTPLGDAATLLVVGPGEFFGELALVSDSGLRNTTVVAVDEVETLALHRDQVEELRRVNAAVDRLLITVLAEEVRRLSARLAEALYVPVERRVYRRLLELAELFAAGDGPCVIPVTQEDIASMAGTTRPTANKVIKAAEDDGVVHVSRGRLEVIDRELLLKRAR